MDIYVKDMNASIELMKRRIKMFIDLLIGITIFCMGIEIGLFIDIYITSKLHDGYICKRHECDYRTYKTED